MAENSGNFPALAQFSLIKPMAAFPRDRRTRIFLLAIAQLA
jgi:hypothetical protein